MTEGVKIDEHKLAAYHAAMLNGGLFVYVPKNVQIEDPVQMVVLHDDEKTSLFNHVLIVADEGSELTYVENYLSNVDKSNEQFNIISEVIAKDYLMGDNSAPTLRRSLWAVESRRSTSRHRSSITARTLQAIS